MEAFTDSRELLHDFLNEAGELLNDVDLKLVELEQRPDDAALLNSVFRGFHTVKGGAGFLEVAPLVDLCHRAENLLDKLRSGELRLTPELMDLILAATAEVRRMFDEMAAFAQPEAAQASLLEGLAAAAAGQTPKLPARGAPIAAPASQGTDRGPDWAALYAAVSGKATAPPTPAQPRAAASSRHTEPQKETTLRVDTARFDQILNLSGEIGLAKNRLMCLMRSVAARRTAAETFGTLDEVVGQLDMLIGDLQTAVMKARMQPVGRIFQKYVRLARDVARGLGKDVELVIEGGDTEVDKTILDELNDPLVHLVRNAVDHGVELPEARVAAGKPARSTVRLSARQTGDQIVIEIADDGRGMRAEVLRDKAVQKGLLAPEEAAVLDERQSLALIFLPGFSTKDQVTDLSGRGVGMDVVKTNIQRLKGRIELTSEPGQGTRVTIRLPLTLAILPVLMLKLGSQPYAVPLAAVRESIELAHTRVQKVGGRPHVVVRGEVLPLVELGRLLGRPSERPSTLGVVVTLLEQSFVLGVDELLGQDEVMIKPLEGVKPRGVAGATISGEGELVLVLELHELLHDAQAA